MNGQTVWLLFRHEVRMLVRDRRTVLLSVLLPSLLMPLMLFGSRYAADRRTAALEQTAYRYVITGGYAAELRQEIAIARIQAGNTTRPDIPEALTKFRAAETTSDDPEADLRSGVLSFYIEAMTAGEAGPPDDATRDSRPGRAGGNRDLPEVAGQSGVRPDTTPLARIVYRGDRDVSRTGSRSMQQLLILARRGHIRTLLEDSGSTLVPDNILTTSTRSVASPSEATGASVGRLMTMFLVIFMLAGGSVAAMDIVAGEKERGTLETLLTTAAGRTEIAAGKQLAILAVALAISVIQVANLLFYVKLRLIRLPEDFALDPGAGTIAALLLLFLPLAATVAAVLLMISTVARTYKEAQLYFFPVYLLSLIPALAGALPGMSLRSAIVLVPVANISVAVRDLMTGRAEPAMIALTFLVMSLTAVLLIRAAGRMLTREETTLASPESVAATDGNSRFRKHVWIWFAVMWAVMFTAAANVPALSRMQPQLLFNQLAVFFGAAVLSWRVYRLNAVETFSLRAPHPAVWLAAVVMIPSGLVTAAGVFRLANVLFPAPVRLLEEMSRQILPDDVPAAQLFLLIAILPGIFEELVFRGTLLHGLRGKFRPWMTPLIAGLIFGVFHFTLFRIIPTAFLGVTLTALCMLSGSIFPGMLVHAGNNAIGVWMTRNGTSLDGLEWSHHAAAAAMLLLSFWIVCRVRPAARPFGSAGSGQGSL